MKELTRSSLPGILLFGFRIGIGSVAAVAKAGAEYACGSVIAMMGILSDARHECSKSLSDGGFAPMSVLSYRGMFAALRSWS